jgi:hypothetical protein
MKAYWSLASLVFFFGLGLYVCVFGNRSIADLPALEVASNSVARDPAAIRRTYDFSMLNGSALESAAKMRILSGAKIVHNNSDVGVELGHFVVKGEDGQKTLACQRYSKLVLTFEGDGSAVNGELPRMEVEGNCEASNDINSISPLMIPVAKILGEPVGDGEFSFRENKPVAVRFANVLDQWPTAWHLKSVRLYDAQKSTDQVVISAEELRDLSAKPVIINFKAE